MASSTSQEQLASSEEQLDYLESRIDQILLLLRGAELKMVCSILRLPEEKFFALESKRSIIRLIWTHLDEVRGEDKEFARAEMERLLKYMEPVADDKPDSSNATGQLEDTEPLEQERRNQPLAPREMGSGKSVSLPVMRNISIDPLSVLRKDFRLTGQIGEGKGCLGFVSLKCQIEEGLSQGYTDKEIVNGVIKSISPGHRLRTILETIPGMTVRRLIDFLRSNYTVKNATDLLQELTSAVQDPKEKASEFVLKALALRQELILASDEPLADVTYSKSLIQRVFLKTIETGLLSPNILFEIRHLLKDESLTEEVLIRAVTKAESVEYERLAKRDYSSSKRAGSHHAHVFKIDQGVPTDTLGTISKQLEELRLEVKELKLSRDRGRIRSGTNTFRKCHACVSSNTNSCTHCFVCSRSGHVSRQCPTRTRNYALTSHTNESSAQGNAPSLN